MTRLDPNETLRRLEAAVTEAREFYGIDPLFETPIHADKADGGAHILIEPGYFHRPISVDLDYYQRNPHLIREDMAHEVAHLVTDELASALQRLPPEFSQEGEPVAMLLVDALEKATVRLDRLFMRERPGDSVRLSHWEAGIAQLGDQLVLNNSSTLPEAADAAP